MPLIAETPPAPPRTVLANPLSSPPPKSSGKALWYVISGVLLVALIAFGILYGSTTGKLNIANTNIISLQNDITAKQVNIDSLNTQLTTEKANSANLQTQLTAAQANVTKVTSDLSTAQTSLTTAQGQIKTIQASLDTANVSVPKLTSDLTTANAKVTTTQAILDKATADLVTANANLTKANTDLATMTTNFNAANTNYKKVADPRHFLTVQDWLAKDDTNTNQAYSNMRPSEKCYILQIKAMREGLLLSAGIDYYNNSVYYNNVAVVGGAIYAVDVLTDQIALEGTTTPYASHPLPLP
jgi:uncharacterized phage infection (PIP) family protein YhgE